MAADNLEQAADAAPSTSGRTSTTCQVCSSQAAKYTCPGCGLRSCSLDCVKQHKSASGCTGKRDRLAYVPLAEYGDSNMLSDYRWLEEVGRAEDVARRSRPPAPKRDLPLALATLVGQARQRGVHLQLMSPGMQRRRSNTTRVDYHSRRLRWRCEWRYLVEQQEATAAAAAAAAAAQEGDTTTSDAAAGVHLSSDSSSGAGQGNPGSSWVSVTDAQVDEGAVLRALLGAHLAYSPGTGARRAVLREYCAAPVEELVVLLRKEGCPANAPRWYQLDTSQSLGAALVGKTLLEYPVLLVALPRHLASGAFTLVPQQEAEQEAAAAQAAIQAQQGAFHQQQQQQGGRMGGRGGRQGGGRGRTGGGGRHWQGGGGGRGSQQGAQLESAGGPDAKRVRFADASMEPSSWPAPPPRPPPQDSSSVAATGSRAMADEDGAELLAGLEAADEPLQPRGRNGVQQQKSSAVQLRAGAAEVMALLGQYDDNEITLADT